LTVTADCNVTVHGNLEPRGQVLQGPIQADPDDAHFAAHLTKRWLAGVALASLMLDRFYRQPVSDETKIP